MFGSHIDRHGVDQRSCQRLVDEYRFAASKYRNRLLEVGATIDTFQKHGIHLRQQLINGIDDVDSHFFHLLGVFSDAISTACQIRATSGESRNDIHFVKGSGLGWIVHQFVERNGVVLGPSDRVQPGDTLVVQRFSESSTVEVRTTTPPTILPPTSEHHGNEGENSNT